MLRACFYKNTHMYISIKYECNMLKINYLTDVSHRNRIKKYVFKSTVIKQKCDYSTLFNV